MLGGEVLYQILLATLIIACVFLIFVLWRLYRILSDVDETMSEVKSTTKTVSSFIEKSLDKISNFSDNLAIITQFIDKASDVIKQKFSQSKENSKKK